MAQLLIKNQGIKMFKRVMLFIMTVMSVSLFTGCTQPDVPINNRQATWNQSNVNDVDLSDLDENLTESEMIMTEDGEQNQMERVAFPTSEYYRLARTGKGTVKGKIYLDDTYKHIPGANTRLYLNPLTSYSEQWYNESYLGGHKMQKADSRLFNYLKFTAADKGGNFAFYGVPSGSYYLIGTVKCGQECGYAGEKSIRIARKVTIQGSQIIERDLTRLID